MKKILTLITLNFVLLITYAQSTIYTNDMEYVVGDVKQAFIQNKITTETQAQYLLIGLKNLGVNAVRVPIFAEGMDPNKPMFDYFYNLVVSEGLPVFANPAQHSGGQRIANGILEGVGGSVLDNPLKTNVLINRIKDFAAEYECKWINPFNEDGAPGGAWSTSQMNTIFSSLYGNVNGAELIGPCVWGIPASISVLEQTTLPVYITVASTHNLGYNHDKWLDFINVAKANGLPVWDSEVNHNISESDNKGTRLEVAIASGVDGLVMYNIWNTVNLSNGAISNWGKIHMGMYLKNMPLLTSNYQINGGSWAEGSIVSADAWNTINLAPLPNNGSWSWTGPNGFSASTREISISNLASSDAGNYVASYTSPDGDVNHIVITVGLNCIVSPSITPYYRINEVSWKSNTSINLDEGDQLEIGPQSSSAGTWIWSGPNDFTSTAREITISDISKSDEGEYTVTRIGSDGCTASKAFNVTVNDVQVPFPDPDARYYIDCPEWDLRLGADGQNAFTTTTSETDFNVQWTVKESTTTGYYYLDCIGSVYRPRIRTDRSSVPNMTTRGSTGNQAKWLLTESANNTYVLSTSLDYTSMPNLQVNSAGEVLMTSASTVDNTVKFTFTDIEKGLVENTVTAISPNHPDAFIDIKFPGVLTSTMKEFKPLNITGEITNYQLEIYSVQGKHLFTTNDMETAWIPSGVQNGLYVYVVSYKGENGTSRSANGKVLCIIQ